VVQCPTLAPQNRQQVELLEHLVAAEKDNSAHWRQQCESLQAERIAVRRQLSIEGTAENAIVAISRMQLAIGRSEREETHSRSALVGFRSDLADAEAAFKRSEEQRLLEKAAHAKWKLIAELRYSQLEVSLWTGLGCDARFGGLTLAEWCEKNKASRVPACCGISGSCS
jgi:hypothetical protein